MGLAHRIVKRFRSTSFRTYVLIPAVVLIWEWAWRGDRFRIDPWFVPIMFWGYLQYRWVGGYRVRRGGGGPGMNNPPERLVREGPYAYCRNPMYLGHIIFLIGLALSLRSWLASAITLVSAIWFQRRVIRDERRLAERFGREYTGYTERVKRWIPGFF